MRETRSALLMIVTIIYGGILEASDRLILEPAGTARGKKIVLISGDEEYRSEEALPMLAKILSQRHGFHTVVLFSFGPDGAGYIDSNNQHGLRGLEELETADLMIIATRFRQPDAEQATHIANYLNAGKPVIGLRTATHAFRGDGTFGGTVTFNSFGRTILGEEWVSHHGRHKVEGGRSVVEPAGRDHPILRGVEEIFTPSDVYGVIHLTENDDILLRGAVTKSLDPDSPTLTDDTRNNPMQPFAWIREYSSPNGAAKGQAFCTTAGASVDFVDEDLRRLVVNAAIHLTGGEVPEKANVEYVDPYYPTFYCFINDPDYYRNLNWTPETFALGQAPHRPDPPGNPDWPYRPVPPKR